jgi:hypothetical protein
VLQLLLLLELLLLGLKLKLSEPMHVLRMLVLRILQWRLKMRKLHGRLTVSLPTIVPLQCLPNELLQDWWVGEELHQQKSTASGGTVRTTGPVGGGTSTTLVVVRRTATSTTVIGLLVNNGNAGDKTGCIVTGLKQTGGNEHRCWRRSVQNMKKLQHSVHNLTLLAVILSSLQKLQMLQRLQRQKWSKMQ